MTHGWRWSQLEAKAWQRQRKAWNTLPCQQAKNHCTARKYQPISAYKNYVRI